MAEMWAMKYELLSRLTLSVTLVSSTEVGGALCRTYPGKGLIEVKLELVGRRPN